MRRPVKGNGHSADFVDGESQDWDVKAPKSRAKIIESAKARAEASGRKPPEMSPDKPLQGEYETSEAIEDIVSAARTPFFRRAEADGSLRA